MIDLSQWRASIGGWNSHCTSYYCPSSSPNKISAVGDCLGALAVLCGCQVMMSLLSVVLGLRLILMLSGDIELNPGPDCALQIPNLPILSLLLILAGDVETNPGPVTVGELVDASKDLVDWETFAIHLPMISSSDIKKIARDHTGSIDRQKFYLFQLWLNHCPNPSWNDVVQALHKTRNHSMAMKIEEERIIQGKQTAMAMFTNVGYKLQPTAPMEFSSKSASTNNDQSYPIIPSLPPCLTRYSGLLKHKYKNQPVITNEWPPRVGKNYYGRLLLLDKERRDIETEQHKIWNTMRGNIDILPKVTQSQVVDIPDVFKPDSSAIVLIDGPPGVGKTTFCRKLLNMWANGQLPTYQQQRYTVVLYCSLRDKRITGANTLTDIMKICFSDYSIEEVDKYIAENGGDGLLMIFDGWDELSMEHRESSLAVRLICREILIKCTVIVTSRSYASESIMRLNGDYRHFEVIGFEEEEVHKVIEETLHDDGQLASDLVKELDSHKNIESLCYIPLVCSMVILVYKKSKQLPSRLTELYDLFILHAVKRHVQKSSTISIDPKRIQSLKQLPPCISATFNKLCYFAYLSLKENNPKMTFSLPELQEALDVSVVEGYIGLMTTVSVYDEELYQFPHLTIQEFLAAWWIANNDGMDVKAFEEHFEDDHFRMCLRFVAGLTGLKNEKFKEMKYFNIQLDLRCRRDDQYSFDSIYNSHMCNHLISTDTPQRQLHLLYESNSSDLCNHMANTFIDSSFCFQRFCERPNSYDAICMLFFLHSSCITWNKIHLRINEFQCPLPGLIMADNSTDVIESKQLIIECSDVIEPTEGFVKRSFLDKVLHLFSSENVYCKYNKLSFGFGETLIMLLEKPQIKHIYPCLSSRGSTEVDQSSMYQLKKHIESTTTLEELTFEVNISDYYEESNNINLILTVIDGVIRNKSIKSLKISSLQLSHYENTFVAISSLNQLLKINTTLEEIKLVIHSSHPLVYDMSEINAPLRSVRCSWLKPTKIESILARCQHLQSLTIDINNFPQPIRFPITNLFNHRLPKLSKLTVNSLGDSELWVELFTILQTNKTLEELRIRENTDIMYDEVLLSLKNCLVFNKSIKHLNISKFMYINIALVSTITEIDNSTVLTALTEGLSSNETIERLSLPQIMIDITTNEGRSLLDAVFKMKNLIVLQLQLASIDGVYSMITRYLSQNFHIKELHIKLTFIGPEYGLECEHHLEEFVKVVYNHPTLEYVHFDLGLMYEEESELKRIAEQYLYKKQISNCINPHKVLPLIELTFCDES